MLPFSRRFALLALFASAGLVLLSSVAHAGPGFRPGPIQQPNNNFGRSPVVNGIVQPPRQRSMEESFNRQVIRNAYMNLPAYLPTYNPYMPVTLNPYSRTLSTGPTYPPLPVTLYSPVSIYPGVNPYALYSGLYNPYAYGSYLNPTGFIGYGYLYQ